MGHHSNCLPSMYVFEPYFPVLWYFKSVFWSSFSLSYTFKYLHIPTNLRNFVEKGWSRWFNLRQLENYIRALWLCWEWGEHTIWSRKAKFSQQSKYQQFQSYFLTQWFHEELLVKNMKRYLFFPSKMTVQNFPHHPRQQICGLLVNPILWRNVWKIIPC